MAHSLLVRASSQVSTASSAAAQEFELETERGRDRGRSQRWKGSGGEDQRGALLTLDGLLNLALHVILVELAPHLRDLVLLVPAARPKRHARPSPGGSVSLSCASGGPRPGGRARPRRGELQAQHRHLQNPHLARPLDLDVKTPQRERERGVVARLPRICLTRPLLLYSALFAREDFLLALQRFPKTFQR